MPQDPCTTSTQKRRSALAYNLAATFAVAFWLRLNPARARLSDHSCTGKVTFTPWPRWSTRGYAKETVKRQRLLARWTRDHEIGYARKRMLACLAGPAAEANETRWPADTAKAEALALGYAERIGALEQGARWLTHANRRARCVVRDPNIRPVVEAVAAELLRSGAVTAEDLPGIAGRVVPVPAFWGLPAVEGDAR